tara:strand:- start:6 stop:299 length:294 start_codon:yes stop_codon:yes gene_type:complete
MSYTHRIKNGVRIDLTTKEISDLEAKDIVWNNGALDRALNELREKRNRRLAETDWMASSDVTMSDNWKTYRTTLRDLPVGLDTVEKVEAVIFPTKPV